MKSTQLDTQELVIDTREIPFKTLRAYGLEGLETMATLNLVLSRLAQVDGFLGACVVDSHTGMMLGAEGGGKGFDLEIASAGNTQVIRAENKTIEVLGLRDDIEDILITLDHQYHLIRPMALKRNLFLYLAIHKDTSNLAMARHRLAMAEKDLNP